MSAICDCSLKPYPPTAQVAEPRSSRLKRGSLAQLKEIGIGILFRASSEAARTTAIGASRPLRRIPVIVSFLNPQPALSLVGGNRSSYPIADPCRRHEHSNRTPRWGQSREWQGSTPKLDFVR